MIIKRGNRLAFLWGGKVAEMDSKATITINTVGFKVEVFRGLFENFIDVFVGEVYRAIDRFGSTILKV